MSTTQSNGNVDAIQQDRERFSGALKRQAEQIEKLGQTLKFLQNEQQQLEEVAARLIEPLEQTATSGDRAKTLSHSGILSSVRKLGAATYAEQVLASLADEAARAGVRSVVFDVRGRAAWACSAAGFEPELSGGALRTLAIPLNHEGPFQEAFETAEAVETNGESLAGNPNLVAKLGLAASARVLLIPVRSAGSVAAVLYAETGGRRDQVLIDSLKVLGEFAGAQIDRLIALNGGYSELKAAPEQERPETVSAPLGESLKTTPEAGTATAISKSTSHEADSAEVATAAEEEATATPGPAEAAGQDQAGVPAVARFSEEEKQKIHRDAQRFSKLLVSEIELYNKSGVEDGRRNKDLYVRLKKDIDRSRETYEKRFANTVASEVDYFHEELVRRLAENDPALLGSGYPGPSV